ncbi:MAG: hypothetical protein ACF8CQ_00600 [Rhodopirellula sp. JB044]|uniref:hypothetical protein n=1 Tax=Rhodopirellula sp. JB044 TaxID=3342844 RepID=UPI00370B1052
MKLIKLFLLMSCLCLAVGCGDPQPQNMLEGAEEAELEDIRQRLEKQQQERASQSERPEGQ